MSLAGLLNILDDDPQLRDVLARAAAGTDPVDTDLVAPPALRPVLAAALAQGDGPGATGFVLAVTATAREAEDLTAGLGSFLPPDSVAFFPGWETLPHERLSPRSDTVGQRLAVLRRLAHPAPSGEPNGPLTVVVAPVRSLLQPMVAGLGDLEPVTLHPGQECELDDLLTRLVEIGYSRADLVGSRGEIAVRGGIVDVFPPTEEHPLRIEFFGDTIEEVRYFKVADQRSIGPAEHGLWAPPCRELLLTPAVRDRAKELADAHPALADVLGKLAEGGVRAGPGDEHGTARRLRPGGRPRAGLRPGAGPRPRRGTGPHEPGVPRGFLGQRGGRRGGAGGSRARRLPADRAGPRRGGRPRPAVVDDRAVRGDRRGRG
jgi:transcription-repair coupling factor (superfamily II helicase)